MSLKVLRLRCLYYKLARTLGVLDRETEATELEVLGMKVYAVFL